MKIIYRLIILIISLALLLFIAYFVSNYHLTIQGAWKEFEEKEDGIIIDLNGKEDGSAFIIHKDGRISFAIAYHTDIIVFYKDFIIYPTNLNINDKPSSGEFHYSQVKGYGKNYEMRLGLLTNSDAAYIYPISNSDESKFIKDKAYPIIELEKYSKNPLLKGVKLFTHDIDFIEGQTSNEEFKLLNSNLSEITLIKIQK